MAAIRRDHQGPRTLLSKWVEDRNELQCHSRCMAQRERVFAIENRRRKGGEWIVSEVFQSPYGGASFQRIYLGGAVACDSHDVFLTWRDLSRDAEQHEHCYVKKVGNTPYIAPFASIGIDHK